MIRLDTPDERYWIVETKGYDPLQDVKKAAAQRWCAAVNAERSRGLWNYAIVKRPADVTSLLTGAAKG